MRDSQREGELFEACLELSREEREEFLTTTCVDDPELRERIERLLRAHERAEGFLDTLPGDDSRKVANELQRIAPAEEGVGDQIGRYRLIELIGEGAHGSVWLAEQTEDIKRRVALKILKLGMDTKSFLTRFEVEKQVLALLDHPGIAKVFDAGATTFGRPYFVLELVDGQSLLKYADEQGLGITERVDLSIKICQALQHAHQKKVIHRDLKPSNILVSLQDDEAVPKIIDFGIAKSTGERLTDESLLTAIHGFIGTPVYSSPEQLSGGTVRVGNPSDIYSVGAVLYEFLTGVAPFDHKELTGLGLDGLKATVLEKDPPVPSARFSNLSSESKNEIAEQRTTSSTELERQLKGDLDWVIMKCLEKDPDRRYESASALADDLQAFLDFRPVSAAAPSVVYRARKFIRRNRVGPLAWATAATAALCVFVFVFLVPKENSPSLDSFSEIDPSIEKVPTLSLEAMAAYLKASDIVRLNKKYSMPQAIELFENAIELDPNFTLAYVGLANSYRRFTSGPTEGGLSREERIKKSEERREKIYAAAEKAAELDASLPEVQVLQGDVSLMKNDLDGAKVIFDKVIELYPDFAGGYWGLSTWAMAMDRADRLLPDIESYDDPAYMASMEEQLKLYARATELDPTNPGYRSQYAFWLGDMLRFEESLEQFRLAVLHNPEHPKTNFSYGDKLIQKWGRNEEGMLYLRKALALDPHDGRSNLRIALAFKDLGDFDQAARWTERHIAQNKSLAPAFEATLQRYRGEDDLALKTERERMAQSKTPLFYRSVFNDDLRAGRYEELRAWFLTHRSYLFEPKIVYHGTSTFNWAMDLAVILVGTGELEEAQRIAEVAWRNEKSYPHGHRAQMIETIYYIIKGDKERALSVLSDTIESGCRHRSEFDDARLDPIRDHPKFIALMEFVESDRAKRLVNIRAMEANGEFAAVPPLPEMVK